MLGWFDSTLGTLKGSLFLAGPGAKGSLGSFATGDKIYGNCSNGAARVVAGIVNT